MKNKLIRAWTGMDGLPAGGYNFYAMAEIGIPRPGILGNGYLMAEIRTNGVFLDQYPIGEGREIAEKEQFGELKHYLSLLNVDLSDFDKIAEESLK